MDEFKWNLDDWRFAAGVAAVVAVAAFVVERLINRALHRLQAAGTLALLPARILRRLAQWTMLVVVVLSLLALFRVEVGDIWKTLTAVLAVVGIGFIASWSFLSNITAGFIILIWRPFRLGDRVELLPDGPSGEVQDINTMFTILRSEDGTRFAVPNNQFLQHSVKCGAPTPQPPAV